MTRRAVGASQAGVSLFPFLAVLLCTMGVLIVLLFVIARQAQRQAAAEAERAAQADSASLAEVELQIEAAKWRAKNYDEAREKTQEQLTAQRLELSHFEEHMARMRDELAALEQQRAALDAGGAAGEQGAELNAELERLRRLAAAARDELDAATRDAQSRPVSYAVTPFRGPNQTDRRPLYIECRDDGVILQPEGVRLSETDFMGPMGPGNPLAAALRCQSEYLKRYQPGQPASGEPYPLLLVRPNGILAYYAAREAMTSWGGDFGYELIEDDWPIEYPAADVELAQATEVVVAEARERQRMLARAAPRSYAGERPVFRAAPSGGGLVQIGGGSGGYGGAARPGRGNGRWGNGGRNGYGGLSDEAAAGGGDANGDGVLDNYAAALAGPAADGGPLPAESPLGTSPGGSAGDALFGRGGIGNGNGNGMNRAALGPDGRDAEMLASDGTDGSSAGSFTDSPAIDPNGVRGFPAGSPTAGDASGGVETQGTGGGDSQFPSPAPGGSFASSRGLGSVPNERMADAQGGLTGQSTVARDDGPQLGAATGFQPNGQGQGTSSANGGGASAGSSTASSAGSPGGSASMSSGMSSLGESLPQNHASASASSSLARKRGENWGLPDEARTAIPVTRPVRVRCSADQLVVLGNNRPDLGRVILLRERTEDSIDDLVGAVWGRIDSWGTAGRGMYWRPVLSVDVAPGGEGRFQDLQVLLENSGLDVVRKGQRPATVQAPPTPPDAPRRVVR